MKFLTQKLDWAVNGQPRKAGARIYIDEWIGIHPELRR